jgi:hypothetical protein
MQGLKPNADLSGLCGMIRRGGSCPDTKPLDIEARAISSPTWKAHVFPLLPRHPSTALRQSIEAARFQN